MGPVLHSNTCLLWVCAYAMPSTGQQPTLAGSNFGRSVTGSTVQQSGSSFTNLVVTACRPSSTLVAQWSGLSAMLAFPTTLIQRLVGTCAGDVFHAWPVG